jgi:hypothetical protein
MKKLAFARVTGHDGEVSDPPAIKSKKPLNVMFKGFFYAQLLGLKTLLDPAINAWTKSKRYRGKRMRISARPSR